MDKERIHKRWTAPVVGTMIFLACTLLIINQPAAQTDQSKAQPDIKFEDKVYDFGIIQKGDKVEYTFRFKNEGQAPLKIGEVKTSCGCTVPKTYTKEAPPGGEGQIEVIFDSKKFLGAIRKTIYVSSNDPDEPKVNLSIRGSVVADVLVSPPHQLLFGLIQKGESTTKNIVVKQGGTQELKILKVETDLPFISAKIVPQPQSLGNGKNYKVEVKITPDAPEGRFQGTVKIHTNIKRYHVIEQKVLGVVKPKIAKPQAQNP